MTTTIQVHATTYMAKAREAHAAMQRLTLMAILAAADRDRRLTCNAMADLTETPRESMARRIIDLAPVRDRATLREQLL